MRAGRAVQLAECLPSIHKAPSVVLHAYHPSISEWRNEGREFNPYLHLEFKGGLGYMRSARKTRCSGTGM